MKRLFLASLLLAGCSKSSDVAVYKIPKEVPAVPSAHGPGDGHDHGPGDGHDHPAATPPAADGLEQAPASRALNWTDPAGWKRETGSGMRVATYQLGDGFECSVISLSGTAGGDLANVNRWRGQMGLPDVPSLQGLATQVKTPLGTSLLVDLEGSGPQQGKRMVAAIVNEGGTSWFFKLTGPSDAVGRAKPSLVKLLGSLKRG